jgi:hypothetical protein
VTDRLSVLRVFGSALAIYRHNARIVLPVAVLAAFIPAAVELLVAHQLSSVASALVTSAVDSLASVMLAGAAEELVHRWEGGQRRIPLRGVLAKVPPVILPLFVVAVLQGLAVAAGLLLLVVPGFVLLAFTSVVGPVVVAERPGIFRSFRRSFRLVRRSAWRVFAVMFCLELIAVLVGSGIEAVVALIGPHIEEPISFAIGEAATLPLEALAVPVMYWRLRELERRRVAEQEN